MEGEEWVLLVSVYSMAASPIVEITMHLATIAASMRSRVLMCALMSKSPEEFRRMSLTCGGRGA